MTTPYGGDRNFDADLDTIDAGGLPGTNRVSQGDLGAIIAGLRERLSGANQVVNEDGLNNSTTVADVQAPPAPASIQVLDFRGYNTPMSSKRTASQNLDLSVQESSVMEHGESQCTGCDSYYTPQSLEHARTAHCDPRGPQYGCPSDDYAQLWDRESTAKEVGHLFTGGVIDEGDVVEVDGDPHVVKTTTASTRLASTQDYLELLVPKTASDSELYYRGYQDGINGRELDEDLAELNDDYFHGYDQSKHYRLSPLQTAPSTVYDIKPNSNQLHSLDHDFVSQDEASSGPAELLQGTRPSTASIGLPSDVIKKFFESN